jgi:hypothetical protein
VRIHRGVLPPSDVVEHGGYTVTTPTRSLVDVAAADLPPDQLVIAVRDAIQRGVTTRPRLLAHAETLSDRATLLIERALGAIAATQ